MKPGIAFGDEIRTEKIPKRRYEERDSYRMRSLLMLVVLVVSAGILTVKLFSLQVVNGSYYRALSDSNRTRTAVIFAPRGIIFDRHNKPLVYNQPGFRQINKDKTSLMSHEEALEKIAKGDTSVAVDSLRQYPYKDAMAHILGYVGQMTEEELKSGSYDDYHITDHLGKAGIELEYEAFLRGVNGKQLYEVDATGKVIRMLGQTDPIPGQNIVLTIDAPLQQAVYDAAKDIKRGAVIVSTPDGQILALLSKPSFDPNLFTLDSTYEATDTAYTSVTEILTDGIGQPLLDRAIGGVYPPASTFKLVTSAAGLNDKTIDGSYLVEDTGILKVGEFSYANWFYTQHGKKDKNVTVVKGLSRSNDIFYYKLAEKIGVTKLAKMASELGVGKKLGIDLPGEAKGTLPTPDWKKKVIGESWYLGDSFHYGIGQGYLLTTPLQVNAFTQAFVNNGKIYRPHLLKSMTPSVIYDAKLTDTTVSLVRQGMIEACSEGGTAYPLFDFTVKNKNLKIDGKNILEAPKATSSARLSEHRKIVIACKTGTAEQGGEDSKPHAWMTLFAPAYDPEIVVTVLAEAAGEGSAEAAPVAKEILEAYFSNK